MNENKIIKIWLECWWPCNSFEDQDIIRYIRIFGNNITYVIDNNNPDIVIFSVFVNSYNEFMGKISMYPDAKKILFIGEPYYMYPVYNWFKSKNIFDLVINFDRDEIENKQIRVPLWIFYNKFDKFYKTDRNYISIFQHDTEIVRDKFATMICSGDRSNNRAKMANFLSKIEKVDCPSVINNNHPPIPDSVQGKIDFIRQYKVNICPENRQQEGYVTEKLFHALEGGCIPLYWGNSDPEPYVIDKDKIIFYTNDEDEELLNKFREINSEEGFKKNKIDMFLDTANLAIHDFIVKFELAFLRMLNLIPSRKIICLYLINEQLEDKNLKYNEVHFSNSIEESATKLKEIYNKMNNNDILVFIKEGFDNEIIEKNINLVKTHPYGFVEGDSNEQINNFKIYRKCINNDKLFQEKNSCIKMIQKKCIHVGASEAEERTGYDAAGFTDIFYIEAIPYMVDHCQRIIDEEFKGRTDRNYKVVQGLVWSENDVEKDFHVFNNHTFASIHGINENNWRWPNIKEGNILKLKSSTLDKLLEDHNVNTDEYEFLCIDVQGAEYEVLEGAIKLLPKIKLMLLEASTVEYYKGQKIFPDLKKFLEERDFIVGNPGSTHDDIAAYRKGYEHYTKIIWENKWR